MSKVTQPVSAAQVVRPQGWPLNHYPGNVSETVPEWGDWGGGDFYLLFVLISTFQIFYNEYALACNQKKHTQQITFLIASPLLPSPSMPLTYPFPNPSAAPGAFPKQAGRREGRRRKKAASRPQHTLSCRLEGEVNISVATSVYLTQVQGPEYGHGVWGRLQPVRQAWQLVLWLVKGRGSVPTSALSARSSWAGSRAQGQAGTAEGTP